MSIKAISKLRVLFLGKIISITQSISKRFTIFHTTKAKDENSTLINACIKEITEEFNKLTKLKHPIINIDTKETKLLYPGRKKATHKDKNIIPIAKISRILIIFPTIF